MSILAGIGAALAPHLGTIVGSSIAGVAGLGSTAIGNFLRNKSTSSTNKTNMNIALLNAMQQQERFRYQKYLNNNQIQINAADAQKAGINPLAMNGSSLSSGSWSNIDAHQQATDYDMSGINQSAIAIGDMINQRGIANSNNQTSKEVAKGNNDTSVKIAEINAANAEKMNKDRLDSEEKIKEQEMLLDAERINQSNNSDYEQRLETYHRNRFEARTKSLELYRQLRSNLMDSKVQAKLNVALNKRKSESETGGAKAGENKYGTDYKRGSRRSWKESLKTLSKNVLSEIFGFSGEVEGQIEARASELGITFGEYLSGVAVNNNTDDFEAWFNKVYSSKAPTKRPDIKVNSRKDW